MPLPRERLSKVASRSDGTITAISTVTTPSAGAARRQPFQLVAPRLAAMTPMMAAATARTAKLRMIPNDGISTKPVRSVPAMPPSVLSARTRPVSRPT
ncbi:hypothetical protein D9M72_419700 [compost metagenome]